MKRNGFSSVILLFIVALVFIVFGYLFFSNGEEGGVNKLSLNNPMQRSSDGCESNPNPTFTHFPTDIERIVQLNPPLMKVSSGMKGHSYIDVTERVPVYAPADATLFDGVKYREDLEGRGDLDQYTLSFSVSCEVFYFFDHLIDLPEKIANLFPGPAATDTHSSGVELIDIKAGELLGYSAGTSWHNFDFGVVNFTKETVLADDPEYNHSEKYRHADCPYNYFDEEKRKVLFELVGYSDASDLQVIDNLCDQN